MGLKIRCEYCGKITSNGIVTTDNGRRSRYFCSNKCINNKIKSLEEKRKIEQKEYESSLIYRFFLRWCEKK